MLGAVKIKASATGPALTKNSMAPVLSGVHSDKKRISQQKSSLENDQSPKVGIIFVVGNHQIMIHAVPMADGESYGDAINCPMGHEQFWADLQSQGKVPPDEEYMGVPRGRALFSKRTGQFSLLLDRCILKRPKIVREIRRRMNLPARSLHLSTDDHYRCDHCLEAQHE